MTRRYDARRAKASLSYTSSDLADLFAVRVATVYAWAREGLKAIDRKRPHLFAGAAVADFLRARNKPRVPLQDGQIYCVACKAACWPLGEVAHVFVRSQTTADLVGTCPRCARRVFRRVRLDQLGRKTGTLTLRYEDTTIALVRLGEPPHTAHCEELSR